jgi:hypothetical protein
MGVNIGSGLNGFVGLPAACFSLPADPEKRSQEPVTGSR